ncbi:MAG: hypothetical protein AMJ67_13100 [Betaproteobacteria bacterium SG8_41]|nr:MAG: hypothetical protein AMJ67_13100 [Betaproteobacteria bacterium SG8_41]
MVLVEILLAQPLGIDFQSDEILRELCVVIVAGKQEVFGHVTQPQARRFNLVGQWVLLLRLARRLREVAWPPIQRRHVCAVLSHPYDY